ncbi:hypothetical protein BD626DRAFT_570752 [Schizophyllum amplum]|uniref:Transcription initiation factor TFIID subunit 2 n=1 Tax=Schizophyllum amplum TaxID=97359 RepID=A0A550C9R8_9AGAR|nr:hypothetical protein BD626DRAFT_570752 [Auriculariopsis ampla]
MDTLRVHVVLEIDFAGTLWGYTELTIYPTTKDLKTVHLHSRQCTIHTVTVSGHQAEFVHNDYLANLSLPGENNADPHRHAELKRKLYSALQESDEGELSIAIPTQVSLRSSGLSMLGRETTATPEPQTPGAGHAQNAPEYAPIVINIAYSLRNPADGFQCGSLLDPCVDNMWEKCTWEFEIVVPRHLEECDPDEETGESAASPTMVVCSGELVEQVAHPHNSNKTIFIFSQPVPTSVQHVALAAGPFHVMAIPSDTPSDDATALLATTTSSLRPAMSFYSTECGSYPFGSYKVVYVDEMPTQRFDSATLSLITVDSLHGEDGIEQAFEARHVLAQALASQWVGVNIQPKQWSDLWLVNGLSLYITGLFLKRLLGTNEYRFRLKKDMQRILQSDTGAQMPICQPTHLEPPDAADIPFINLKSPVVLHILDRKLGKSGTSLGLSRVLPKVFLSAMSGEMQGNACRRTSSYEYVGNGCPSFAFQATFNRKKMAVEITMRQECPAWKAHEGNAYTMEMFKPAPLFEMTIRIHEADGTPYEHVLDIRSGFKRYDVPFNTKYKRVRRNTKRYLARQAAAQAAAEGDADAAEAIGLIDMGFGLDIWEKEEERENWKVADWTEDEEAQMSGATYEWIRMDADFEWIAFISFDQPDFMWVSHTFAVAAANGYRLEYLRKNGIGNELLLSYSLRGRLARELRCRRIEFLGLFHLFKLFLRYCYETEDPKQDLFKHTYVPKPNDFSDIAEYFVRKHLVTAIARVRFENGKTPPVVRQFLIDQLRFNDNTTNMYSDAFYVSAIIDGLGCATTSTAAPERGELLPTEGRAELTAEDVDLLQQAIDEVERYRNMDRLIPSPHNVVTVAVLEFYTVLMVANYIPNHPKWFFPMTRDGNYTQVRIAAFDGLFMTKWFTPGIMRYVLSVIINDPSRVVRRHVARNCCQSLGLLVQMGELKSGVKEAESLLIEEDGSVPERIKEARKTEMDMMFKVLRKDREVGKNEVLREWLAPLMLSADVDYEVRWNLLKLADLLIKPQEEKLPMPKIHIPPTPVAETPPPLPIKVKPPRPPGRPESPTVVTTPKLRMAPPARRAPPPPVPAAKASKPKQKPAPPPQTGRPPKSSSRPAPKAQSGGMSTNDLIMCRNALKKLQAHKRAKLFLKPVDPVRDHAPSYFDVIKKPMDLATMDIKLNQGLYQDRNAFRKDFELMINNAKTYNPPGTFAHLEAINLETFFEKQWATLSRTLEARVHDPPPPPPAPRPCGHVSGPIPNKTASAAPRRISAPNQLAPPPAPSPSPPQSEQPKPRPTIKLKLGGPSKPSAEPPQKKSKPSKAKSKATPSDVPTDPPPPYEDDGTGDLLEEVLAVEHEREQQREHQREQKREQPRSVSKGKRKIASAVLDEDEILNLASPAKKERRAPSPTPAPTPTPAPAPPRPTIKIKRDKPSAPSPTPRTIAPPRQVAPGPAPATPARPPPPPAAPAVSSVKGKERQISTHPPSHPPSRAPSRATSHVAGPGPSTPSAPRATVYAATPINERKCRELLKTLAKSEFYPIFAQPVDPIRDGCPTYFDEIKHPMDFSTMGKKLTEGQYQTMEDFRKDVELIFKNCRTFNPPTTYPQQCADNVEALFKKEWAKAMEKKLSYTEKRGLQAVVRELKAHPSYFIFSEPVNPDLLGIPTYFNIIPREKARDLRTIQNKLDTDKYESVQAFEADLELMVQNALTFNGDVSEVGQATLRMRDGIRAAMASFRSKKRKDGGEKGGGQPAKKLKMG